MTAMNPARDLRNAGVESQPSNADRHRAALTSVTAALGGRIAFGGDYNPEQWPEDVWAQDIALMREAGVNLVSLGIFSWALLQPKPDVFEFAWLDRILDLLHTGGIRVDLANASASPPHWFSHQYPESMPVGPDGIRQYYGARQTFCPSSGTYRAAAQEITQAIADRYADHPAVVMWHVHNEYGCHNAACYCDVSAEAFRRFLQRRYGDLEELNSAWGTAFWSQRYGDWEEILPPRHVPGDNFINPTQRLDFARFGSEELLDCYRSEAEILRARSDKPVTTNFMGFFPHLDYWRWAGEMAVVSNDHYRITALGTDGATHHQAMSADLTRSLADGEPWLLMEHSTSAVNWQPVNPAKPAGQMRRDSMTHVARGADGALFFQWRQSAAGAEKFHSALVPHAGRDSDRFREVTRLGADLAAISEVTGSRVTAGVAIAFDWDAWWASRLDSHPTEELAMIEQVTAWHRSLWQRGITCDFVHPDYPFGDYRLVLVPSLYACSDTVGTRLAEFVATGGHVAVGPFSGIVDLDDHVRLGGYPGAFREMLGIRVEEFSPLPTGAAVTLASVSEARDSAAADAATAYDDRALIRADAGAAPGLAIRRRGTGSSEATVWTELIRATGASVVRRFSGGVFDGAPAVTVRRAGGSAGAAWYFGTVPSATLLDELLGDVCTEAGVRPVIGRESVGLDVTIRQSEECRYVFAINHTDRDIPLDVTGVDLLTASEWTPGRRVPAEDMAVVRAPLVAVTGRAAADDSGQVRG